MQAAYINKFIGEPKVPSTGKNSVNNMEKKPSELWWMRLSQERLSQQPRGSLDQQISLQKLSPTTDGNRKESLPVDVDAVKITTIIETIRRKVQRSARIAEGENDIRGTIAKTRLKRSLRESESGNDDTKASEDPRHDRDRRERLSPKTKRAADLKAAASSTSIPSTVFYKRIWEYINGTRPHLDIISYSTLEKDSNSMCTDKDPIPASQSRKGELPAADPTVKPERELYKRIWDIINATSAGLREARNAKIRPKRDANVSTGNTFAAASDLSCVQDEQAEGDKRTPTTNEEAQNPPEVSAEPHISGFWAVADPVQWQPEAAIPLGSSDSTSASRANEATEAADLNRPEQRPAQNVLDGSAGENSTAGHAGEERRGDEPQDLTEPYPLGRENSNGTSFSPSASTIDKASRKDDRAKYVQRHDETGSPLYDPSSIPYVEVPDYSDRREDTLDKSKRGEYKEYDDGDYVEPESFYRADDSSSAKSPSGEIHLLPGTRVGNDKRESSSELVNASRPRCTENQDSAECADKREDDEKNSDARQLPKASEEREDAAADFAPIHFDISEYTKPFDLEEFLKADFDFEHDATSETEARRKDDEKNADDGTKESEKSDRDDDSSEEESARNNDEYEAAYPKAGWYDYFAKNADSPDYFGAASEGDRNQEEQDGKFHEEAATSGETVSEDPRDDGDLLKHIFRKDDEGESQTDVADTEGEFLSRYFTEDMLRQLHDNSTAVEEDRKREESRNREDVQKTLSKILNEKDRFSRLDDNLNKMIKEGDAVPIRYNNFWSLQYESPRRKNNEEREEEEEEAEEEEEV